MNPITDIDKTTVWCYDVGGNITSRTEYAYTTGTVSTATDTYTYTYANSWKDQLTSFNGQSISYDQVGNPTTYKGASLTWARGRNMATYHIEGDDQYFDMCYDASGKRVSKRLTYEDPAENEVTTYIYNGNNLVCEKADDGETVSYKYYLYNSQGVIGFIQDGVTYTYHKNLFGDIVAIYQGATKVAEYAYDAWGNCTIVSDSWNIGASNPFRYRGYYYDTDLNLYYLMSRYYDPLTGRFINADSLEYLDPETIGGLNLYAYCGNNPIMYTDHSGHIAISLTLLGLIIGAAIGATAGGIIAYNAAKESGAEGWELFAWTMAGVIGGGIIGGALGAGLGAIVTKVTGVIGLSITKYSILPIKATTVLGHMPGYISAAQATGAGYYLVSDKIYNEMVQKGVEWANNMTYLKDAHSLGSQFALVPNFVVREGGTFWKEIQYLIQNGIPWELF